MRMASVAFLFGIWWLQLQPALVRVDMPFLTAVLACLTVILLACVSRLGRGLEKGMHLALVVVAVLASSGAGFLYAALRAEIRLDDSLQHTLEGRDLTLTGVVEDLPQSLSEGVRFVFAVEHADGTGGEGVPSRVLLSWYRARGGDGDMPRVVAGERWRFTVRLKRPHGSAVPGGFDYEAWLLERNLRATGYVRKPETALRLNAGVGGFMHAVHRLRAGVRASIHAALPDAPHAGVLIALAVGDQGAISPSHWEVLRRTGVSHLVAISGMHISLVGLMVGGLCAVVWRRVPWLVLRVPVRKAAALAALGAGLCYALLAGLGIPVQRAVIMLFVVVLALLLGRESSPGRVLALALVCVLAVDPWAVLAAGFWLSFGAVAVILLVTSGRVRSGSGWRVAIRVQLAITLATIPALLALFQAFSLVSPLANAIAIPLVSFVITPLTLGALLWPSPVLLIPAHTVSGWMLAALAWLADSRFALWQQAQPPGWMIGAACVAIVFMVLPRATPGRGAALAVMGALLSWQAPRPGWGEFRAMVLDVGQGLSVHVQTANHDVLYDTGPAYGASDAGARVVVPYLSALGVDRIDRLVLSHDDADHVGGTQSLLDGIPANHILAGDEASTLRDLGSWAGDACTAGRSWEWDGVRFEVLWPAAGMLPARRNNEHSCVLRIGGDGGGSLLLVGDIEQLAESALVRAHGEALASSAIVVAHHGSRSSSIDAFVNAVMAEVAVFSVGHLNRFGHPHPSVWARWATAGARGYRTDSQGSIALDVGADGVTASAWRERHPRYWQGR